MAPFRWRFVPPNVVTAAGLVLGTLAVQSALAGRPVAAAWWGLLVCLTDKLDGLLASLLKASSAFGVQLDSLADLVAFGVVPSAVFYAYFSTRPELGWGAGAGLLGLRAITCLYVVAAGVRLAKFNVAAAEGPSRHYTGVPSTMTAGILLTVFLTTLKYAAPGAERLDDWRWLGGLRLDGLLPLLPWALLAGGAAMLSPLRVPKLGRTPHRVTDVLLFSAVAFGYGVGVARHLPEYLAAGGLLYLAVSVAYHLRTRGAAATAR